MLLEFIDVLFQSMCASYYRLIVEYCMALSMVIFYIILIMA